MPQLTALRDFLGFSIKGTLAVPGIPCELKRWSGEFGETKVTRTEWQEGEKSTGRELHRYEDGAP